jgi:hypothetical protein
MRAVCHRYAFAVKMLTILCLQSPEIQQMYSLPMPVSKIRTKIRQEFERHRFVNSLPAVDVLLTQSHMEFQVGGQSLVALSEQPDQVTVGDSQLLETTHTYHEVF